VVERDNRDRKRECWKVKFRFIQVCLNKILTCSYVRGNVSLWQTVPTLHTDPEHICTVREEDNVHLKLIRSFISAGGKHSGSRVSLKTLRGNFNVFSVLQIWYVEYLFRSEAVSCYFTPQAFKCEVFSCHDATSWLITSCSEEKNYFQFRFGQ